MEPWFSQWKLLFYARNFIFHPASIPFNIPKVIYWPWVDGGGTVFEGSGEIRPGIEEACNYGVVLCEYLDDCWQTEDSWGGLMT